MTISSRSSMLMAMRGSGWLRKPVAQFVLIGTALFLADRVWRARRILPDDAGATTIVISAERIARLRDDFNRRMGARPTTDQEALLIEQEIDEELLYREALARGLDRDDSSVRSWLVNKMRFVSDDPEQNENALYDQARALGLDRDDIVVRRILAQKMRLLAEHSGGRVEPNDAEVREYFRAHQDLWTRPPRVSLRHVFLSRDRHGDEIARLADELLGELRDQGADGAAALGDPFPLGRSHRARSRDQLEKLFGAEFADRVMELEPGRWQGPVPSAYGLHLVFVEQKLPPEVASLASVQNQVSRRLAAERREEELSQALARLRQQYEIRVERSASEGSASSVS